MDINSAEIFNYILSWSKDRYCAYRQGQLVYECESKKDIEDFFVTVSRQKVQNILKDEE